jgi:hypothetical protein
MISLGCAPDVADLEIALELDIRQDRAPGGTRYVDVAEAGVHGLKFFDVKSDRLAIGFVHLSQG